MTDEQQTLTDIAGNEIQPGDSVVYPQMSGRSVQMVLGKLVSYNGKTAQVLREEGSRWKAAYTPSTRYRDKRTGKGIDPHAGKSYKHYKVKPIHKFTHKETSQVVLHVEGEEASEQYQAVYNNYYNTRWYTTPRVSEWTPEYHEGEYHDYVEKYQPEPKPVTIQNVGNIVKVTVSD